MSIIRPDGTVAVRIIGPGKGSSATYEAAQLKRDMGVFGKGTQVFIDHPSTREERERPERSIRDLCGVTVCDPEWRENGEAGPGPYTRVKIFKPYREEIEEKGEHIGVSIRAAGTVTTKKIGNESVRVAEKFTAGSFDFVTKAGAGGKVVKLAESTRGAVDEYVQQFLEENPQESETSDTARASFIEWATGDTQPHDEEDSIMTEQLKEKDDRIEALETQLAEAQASLRTREIADIIEAAISEAKDLPQAAAVRVKTLMERVAPKDGDLDKEALTVLVKEAIQAEQEYIESLLPKRGGITGMGGGSTDGDGKKRLRESMIALHIERGETQEQAEKLADLAMLGR